MKGGGWSGEDSEGMSLQGQLQTKPRAVWRGSVPLACPCLLYPPECTPTPSGLGPQDTGERTVCVTLAQEQGPRSRDKHFPYLLRLQRKEKPRR